MLRGLEISYIAARVLSPTKTEAHVEWVKTQTTGVPATNTGDWSAATNTGDRSAAEVSGSESVAIVTGRDSKVRGARGCGIVATERNDDGDIIAIKAALVDGEKIKADTWYKLVGGEFVEA